MPQLARSIMQKLYGGDIWQGFAPAITNAEVQGWNGTHPSLAKLAVAKGSAIVVDVGVWKGQSTITMANAMKRDNIDGVVIAVDTFLGSPEHWSRDRNLFERKNGLPNLYEIFLSNVAQAGLADYIVPLAQTSSTACRILRSLGIRPTIVHVDAAHEYREALIDMEDYWEILHEGGFLIGDDYDDSWPGVVRAAGEFSARVLRPLQVERPKFILQKT